MKLISFTLILVALACITVVQHPLCSLDANVPDTDHPQCPPFIIPKIHILSLCVLQKKSKRINYMRLEMDVLFEVINPIASLKSFCKRFQK
jgi:hypothetical protein